MPFVQVIPARLTLWQFHMNFVGGIPKTFKTRFVKCKLIRIFLALRIRNCFWTNEIFQINKTLGISCNHFLNKTPGIRKQRSFLNESYYVYMRLSVAKSSLYAVSTEINLWNEKFIFSYSKKLQYREYET